MTETILAIETSCDETAVSIVSGKKENGSISQINVHAHIVESQIEIHAPFGGVVPEVAARDHLAKIDDIAKRALAESNLKLSDLSAIAVTLGPGLVGALMVGVLYARGLAFSLQKPLVGVNHVDAHLAPALLLEKFSARTNLNQWVHTRDPEFPAIALTVSGGHCHLSYLTEATEKQIIGKTLDDACGEAFDKVGKLLGLGYPGGPLIEKIADEAVTQGNTENKFNFPVKMAGVENKFNFSYSGIKTAVLEHVRKETGNFKGKISGANLPHAEKQRIAYAFQEAALGQLFDRVQNALRSYADAKCVFIAGGVAQNKRFREIFSALPVPVVFAPASLCSDNATMIGLQALLTQKYDGMTSHPFPRY